MRYMTIAMVLCATGWMACASSSGNARKSTYAFNRISSEDIQQAALGSSARDLIEKLRPSWLQTRGPKSFNASTSSSFPSVYLNRHRFGGIGSLSSISANDIVEIRYYNATQAGTKFGPSNVSGVIDIITH